MKPRKYPYSGRQRLVRKEMPRLINLGNIAINSELVQYIDFIKKLGPNQSLLIIRINKLLSYREKEIRILMDIDRVVARLNQYSDN